MPCYTSTEWKRYSQDKFFEVRARGTWGSTKKHKADESNRSLIPATSYRDVQRKLSLGKCHVRWWQRADLRTFSEAELHVTTDRMFMHLLLFRLIIFFLSRMTRTEGLIYTCREGTVGEDNLDEGSGSQRRFGGKRWHGTRRITW